MGLSDKLSKCMMSLFNLRPELKELPKGLFFSKLHKLSSEDCEAADVARAALSLIYQRRTVSHMAAERPLCAMSIINALPVESRAILFCERIHAAGVLHHALAKRYPGQVGLYHSKMGVQPPWL
jgi:hypothetical protein